MKQIFILLVSFFLFSSAYGKGEKNLVIGDSNGAASNGWVAQLQQLRPQDTFCNLSISGNTIGFNNVGQDTLNTLRNIESYLCRGEQLLGGIDRILILLGTNDCKAAFDSSQQQVPGNLDGILNQIEHHYQGRLLPKITYISPPPITNDTQLETKYHGGKARLAQLIPQLEKVIGQHGYPFVNLHDSLEADYDSLHTDGIHLNEAGYIRSAQLINQFLK